MSSTQQAWELGITDPISHMQKRRHCRISWLAHSLTAAHFAAKPLLSISMKQGPRTDQQQAFALFLLQRQANWRVGSPSCEQLEMAYCFVFCFERWHIFSWSPLFLVFLLGSGFVSMRLHSLSFHNGLDCIQPKLKLNKPTRKRACPQAVSKACTVPTYGNCPIAHIYFY